jgi:hypothetical protein
MLPFPLWSENQILPSPSIASEAGVEWFSGIENSLNESFWAKNSPSLPAENSTNQNVSLGAEIIALGPELLVGIANSLIWFVAEGAETFTTFEKPELCDGIQLTRPIGEKLIRQQIRRMDNILVLRMFRKFLSKKYLPELVA